MPRGHMSEASRRKQQAKAEATRQVKRERRQCILLEAGPLKVFRLDAMNFVVTTDPNNANKYAYYRHLKDAAKALLAERIDQTARPGIQAILQAIDRAEREIVASIEKGEWANTESITAR